MAESRKRAILASATLDFASIAANTASELTVTVAGAAVGDVVAVGAPDAIEAGLIVSGYVSDVNEVTVRVANVTVGAVDPASADFSVAVIK